MDKGTEVITTEGAQSPFDLSIAAIADTNLIAIAEQAEARLAAFEKIWKGSLSRTNAHDWVNEGGKPYLQASGAQKIARWLGVSWRVNSPTEEDLGSGHYLISYTGEFALGGAIITALGTRSSKDPFFSKAKGIQLPASEIDKGNVMKAAYTNLLGNGITSLLGLRNLTWEDLDKHASIKQASVTSVAYGKSARAPSPDRDASSQGSQSQKSAASYPSHPDEPASEAQLGAIHTILSVTLAIKDELSRAQKVATILGLKDAPTSMSKLTKGQASKVIEKLNEEARPGASVPVIDEVIQDE